MERARFQRAIGAIDTANAEDPTAIIVDGSGRPRELVYSEMVSRWVDRLVPQPSEALLLAARAHHIRRWTSPRSGYPDGRAGYLRWRRELSQRQADEVGRILAGTGYDDATVERVKAIVRKQNLADDPEVQALEDAICLVFLETQYDDLAGRLDRDKMVEVLRKTMKKMSPTALSLVGSLTLSEQGQALLEAASSS